MTGWGLAGTGNSSAVVAAAVIVDPRGDVLKIAKTRRFLKGDMRKVKKKHPEPWKFRIPENHEITKSVGFLEKLVKS